MSFRKFLTTTEFRKTVFKIVLVYSGVLILSWFLLNWYTDHGKFVSVPELRGKSLQEAIATLEERDLGHLVIDSIYDRKATPGEVVDQSPGAESQVKEGRQVFLTIYRFSPPMETVNIKEGDYAAVAMIKLQNKGIECDTVYEDNNTFAGSVIRVIHRGRKIKPETQIARGDRLTLVIGRAVSGKVIVPDLRGLTCKEVEMMLDTMNLICNCKFEPMITEPTSQDSVTYRVCRQDPEHDPVIGTTAGRIVDIWLYNTPCPADTSSND